MNIGLVLSQTPTYSETFFMSKIKGLQHSGYEVTLFVQKKAPDFSLCKVKRAPQVFKRNVLLQIVVSVYVLAKLCIYPKRLQKFVTLEIKAKRPIKQILKNLYNNAHILTAHLEWLHFGFATMALQSENVAKAIGARMGVSFRGYDLDVYPLKHQGCYTLLWENVDQVHSISNYLMAKAHGLGLSKATPYQIITPAVDFGTFERSDSKLQNKCVQLLTVARLEWIKGLSYSIEAMALLKKRGVEFQYTIIGTGSMKQELLFSIYQLELLERITILDHMSHEKVKGYLQNTDVYIQYSLSEGFCNAVLEAQAMGVLCVVSNGGALPENIVEDETGWIVEKRNPKVLADVIEKVIKLPQDQKTKISGNAINRINEQFTWPKQQELFSKFYE